MTSVSEQRVITLSPFVFVRGRKVLIDVEHQGDNLEVSWDKEKVLIPVDKDTGNISFDLPKTMFRHTHYPVTFMSESCRYPRPIIEYIRSSLCEWIIPIGTGDFQWDVISESGRYFLHRYHDSSEYHRRFLANLAISNWPGIVETFEYITTHDRGIKQ